MEQRPNGTTRSKVISSWILKVIGGDVSMLSPIPSLRNWVCVHMCIWVMPQVTVVDCRKGSNAIESRWHFSFFFLFSREYRTFKIILCKDNILWGTESIFHKEIWNFNNPISCVAHACAWNSYISINMCCLVVYLFWKRLTGCGCERLQSCKRK